MRKSKLLLRFFVTRLSSNSSAASSSPAAPRGQIESCYRLTHSNVPVLRVRHLQRCIQEHHGQCPKWANTQHGHRELQKGHVKRTQVLQAVGWNRIEVESKDTTRNKGNLQTQFNLRAPPDSTLLLGDIYLQARKACFSCR